MSAATYLCYDLKGIQSFIFAIPKLKPIVGGSALIDVFDRETARNLDLPGVEWLFSGGGKGAFLCADAAALAAARDQLVRAAHQEGLGISFGMDPDYNEAAHQTGANHPYLPDDLEGQPCSLSGLYPTGAAQGVHPLVKRRLDSNRHYENELLKRLEFPAGMSEDTSVFFRDVNEGDEEGQSGAAALGGRNRWAVIAMDGNDMGTQHRAAVGIFKDNPKGYQDWLKAMSRALDECCRSACQAGISMVLHAWSQEEQRKATDAAGRMITLPVRPLVVGGDDILVLCHVRHALDFVKTVCAAFERLSREKHEKYFWEMGHALWPATGGKLTISAGVLFAPVTLPLASAIPYAESLLASAKGRGRGGPEGQPSPACLDWESVTEGLLDSPAARRRRELQFIDPDNGVEVRLTRRPYLLSEFATLERLAATYSSLPGHIRHQVVRDLRAGYWDRQISRVRLAKQHRELASDLEEISEAALSDKPTRWRKVLGETAIDTDVVDALLWLEEGARMEWTTTGGKS